MNDLKSSSYFKFIIYLYLVSNVGYNMENDLKTYILLKE